MGDAQIARTIISACQKRAPMLAMPIAYRLVLDENDADRLPPAHPPLGSLYSCDVELTIEPQSNVS